MSCVLCGTDSPSVVYYVGKGSTHCGDCWIIVLKDILMAQPNFVLDGNTPIGDEMQDTVAAMGAEGIELVYNSGGDS